MKIKAFWTLATAKGALLIINSRNAEQRLFFNYIEIAGNVQLCVNVKP